MATLTIFSADWCRHCVAAHAFIDEKLTGMKVERVDVGREPWRRRQMLAALPAAVAADAKTGTKPMTIPQIFIGANGAEEYVGGNSELRALHESGGLGEAAARVTSHRPPAAGAPRFPPEVLFGPEDVLREIPAAFREKWKMNIASLEKALRASGDHGELEHMEILVTVDAPGQLVVVGASAQSSLEAGAVRARDVPAPEEKLYCLRAIESSKTFSIDCEVPARYDEGGRDTGNADYARGMNAVISAPWRQRAGSYLVGTVTVLARVSAPAFRWPEASKRTVELFRDLLERDVTALARAPPAPEANGEKRPRQGH